MQVTKILSVCFVVLGFNIFQTPKASAASFGCESVGGSVIFKDTLYGALTGTVLSGLVLLASSSEGDNAGSTLAIGTAAGAGLGLGLGIAEVAFRDCPPHHFGAEKGFHSALVALPTPGGKLGSGVKLSWNF